MSTHLARACVFSLLLASACFAGENQPCRLRRGLYAERTGLQQKYDARVGNNGFARQQIEDSLSVIDKEYFDFLQSLADAALKDDEKSLQICSSVAKVDPLASQMVALVLYLHNGRKDAAPFVASFPKSKQQLINFLSLDLISTGGTTEAATSLPGIPLPDGLVDKFITELYFLVLNGNQRAIQEYAYLYENSTGEYAEFMGDQAAGLFRKHADLVLQEWPLFRPIAKQLSTDEAISMDDYKAIASNFRKLCSKRQNQSCAEALALFHP